jgi:inhibitor of KinA
VNAQAAKPPKFPEICQTGYAGLVVRFGDQLNEAGNRASLAFAAEVIAAGLAGVLEVSTALQSVLLRYDPLLVSPEALRADLAAALTQRDWYAAELCATSLRVQAIGFAPSQPYLGELPPNWNFPRQATLNPQVPKGALVAAIRQIVLFSVPSPTGWLHIGQTGLSLFDPARDPAFMLRAGDEIALRPVSEAEFETSCAAAPYGGAVRRALP